MTKIKIGDSFPSLKGGVLIVTSITTNHCICECSICNKDTELFPLHFNITKESLKKGRPLCGCHPKFVYSEDAYTLLVQRECTERGMVFKGFSSTFKGSSTKLDIICKEGHSWNTPTITNLLAAKSDCKKCSSIRSGARIKHTWKDKKHITDKGSILTVISEPEGKILDISCDVCNEDTELFPTTFKQGKSDWSKKIPCGCGVSPRYTKNQYKIKCKRVCDSLGDRKFIAFVGDWLGCDTKVITDCLINPDHGTWESSSIDKLIRKNPRSCPKCSDDLSCFGRYRHRDYEMDNLYLLKFTHKSGEQFIKCGRTFDMTERINNMNKHYSIDVLGVHKAIHHHVFTLEKAMHRKLKDLHLTPSIPFGGSINECFNIKCLENVSIKNLFNV